MKAILPGAALVCALASAGATAAADPVHVGVTALLVNGRTQDRNGATSVPPVPVPMFDVRVPLQRFEIYAEAVPPIGPVGYNDRPDNGPSVPGVTYWHGTKLGYGFAAIRYRVSPLVSVGIGETLYNQQTINRVSSVDHWTLYVNGRAYPATSTSVRDEIDSSRVPGLRVEALAAVPMRRKATLTAMLAVTPAMHALLGTCLCDTSTFAWALGSRTTSSTFRFSNAETASETDAALGLRRDVGRYTMTWGIRYANYIAHFNVTHTLADHDSIFAPFVNFERAVGRQ